MVVNEGVSQGHYDSRGICYKAPSIMPKSDTEGSLESKERRVKLIPALLLVVWRHRFYFHLNKILIGMDGCQLEASALIETKTTNRSPIVISIVLGNESAASLCLVVYLKTRLLCLSNCGLHQDQV